MTHSSETEAQHVGTLWMLNLDKPLPVGIVPRVPTAFMRVGSEAVEELAQAMGSSDDPARVLQRFATGRRCYFARIEGKLASYGWVTFDEEAIGEIGLSIRLKPGEAYIWDCATLPEYRGQRLYPALLSQILGELQREGLHRVWIGADADNLPSQNGLALAGFQPVIDILLTRTPTMHKASVRGRPDVPTQDVADAHHALFGNRSQV